ncbi:MAG: 30S ribosomal protein S8e [Candidatus Woesearchaeota archaeon]|nr:30S ribosomal protein S8e [Candidatus Woesearchaeota archaeon]
MVYKVCGYIPDNSNINQSKTYLNDQTFLMYRMLTQYRSKRKITGGRYKKYRGKRLYETARIASLTKLGKTRLSKIQTLGGNSKNRLLREEFANVVDPKTNKAKKTKIKTILENPANRHYVRRNIMTKGTVIDTELGKAKITSRPGQDGTVNAVLIS